MRLLSMAFFCKKEVAFLALPLMIKNGIDLKLVSKLLLKQLLDYNNFGNVYDFCSRRTGKNTKEGFLIWVQGSW